jgi:hypothetical protein
VTHSSRKNILGIELEKSYDEYFSDEGFLYFCINQTNQIIQPKSTKKHELQNHFKQWVYSIINNYDFCGQIFSEHRAFIFTPTGINIYALLDICTNKYTYNKIGDEHLDWIDKGNDRQVAFVKSLLTYITGNKTHGYSITQTPQILINNFIKGDENPFTKNATSMTTIKNSLTCMECSAELKVILINQIKSAWMNSFTKNKISEWIEKERDLPITNWLRQQDVFTNTISYWLSSYAAHDFTKVIILHFDLLTMFTPDTATLKLKQLKQSWSQAKTREKNKENTQINFVITEKTKEMLIEICDTIGVSRNKYLETIINNEYNKFKGDRKE